MKPNLFAYATKELSQDAFLAWLLQWADPDSLEHDAGMHLAAADFVKRLIALQDVAPEKITRVEAGRQWENIDVWAKVNDSHLVIIEDKVGTGEHSNQLARYQEIAGRWCREKSKRLVCVYLKTQSDSSANLEHIAGQGYAVFARSELLDFLNAHETENDIYNDFRDRLREIEAKESRFSEIPIGQWEAHEWRGFYQELESHRRVVNWGYVANPSGGFWNAVLNWFECADACPYMQIEQGDLCFKVGEVYENRRDIRERYHHRLMSAAKPDMALERPARFGSGTYMTVAKVPRSAWLGADDQVVDFGESLKSLNYYESWLIDLVEASQPAPAAQS